jgi:peroxiredoxin
LHNDHEKQKFGEPLRDFSLPDLKGNTVSLSQRLEGKKAGVVVFWSGVCTHCVRYADYLNTFEEVHPDVTLLAVASRHGETAADINKVVADQKLRFGLVHDADGRVAKEWYAQQTPRAFLMDPRRALVYRGAIDNFKFKEDAQFIPYLETASLRPPVSDAPSSRSTTPCPEPYELSRQRFTQAACDAA